MTLSILIHFYCDTIDQDTLSDMLATTPSTLSSIFINAEIVLNLLEG